MASPSSDLEKALQILQKNGYNPSVLNNLINSGGITAPSGSTTNESGVPAFPELSPNDPQFSAAKKLRGNAMNLSNELTEMQLREARKRNQKSKNEAFFGEGVSEADAAKHMERATKEAAVAGMPVDDFLSLSKSDQRKAFRAGEKEQYANRQAEQKAESAKKFDEHRKNLGLVTPDEMAYFRVQDAKNSSSANADSYDQTTNAADVQKAKEHNREQLNQRVASKNLAEESAYRQENNMALSVKPGDSQYDPMTGVTKTWDNERVIFTPHGNVRAKMGVRENATNILTSVPSKDPNNPDVAPNAVRAGVNNSVSLDKPVDSPVSLAVNTPSVVPKVGLDAPTQAKMSIWNGGVDQKATAQTIASNVSSGADLPRKNNAFVGLPGNEPKLNLTNVGFEKTPEPTGAQSNAQYPLTNEGAARIAGMQKHMQKLEAATNPEPKTFADKYAARGEAQWKSLGDAVTGIPKAMEGAMDYIPGYAIPKKALTGGINNLLNKPLIR